MYSAQEVKKGNNIFWTGVLDYDIRTFDIIMHTEYGTTYNSYIVKGSHKTALIEVAKEGFFDEFLERVKDVCDPTKIDYIIANHTEPDHSGSLVKMLEIAPQAEVIGSMSAIRFLKEITNRDFTARVVKDGDTLDLGGKTLKFIMAPFLHWPDTMYTYAVEDKTLFTCDSFGCHYCSDKVFSDVMEDEDFYDAYKYYFDNIMGPFKSFVTQALNKIKDLEIETICTGHGPVLRNNIDKYLGYYQEWAQVEHFANPTVAIPYCTSYGYTKKIAEKIKEGIQSVHVDAILFDVTTSDKAEIMACVEKADGILIGSPTLVGDTLPPIWELLSHLNPYIHKGKLAGAFGSYGWSGEAVPNIEMRLNQLKFAMPSGVLRIMFNPSEAQLEEAFNYGQEFGQQVANLRSCAAVLN